MKMWSRGLGRTELKMDCRYYTVKKDPDSDNFYIIGKITDPVNWELKVTIEPEDIPGLVKMALNWCVFKLTFKNLYKYVVFLFNRRKYQEAAGDDIVEKVDAAYAGMMSNGRKRLSKLRTDDTSGKVSPRLNKASCSIS